MTARYNQMNQKMRRKSDGIMALFMAQCEKREEFSVEELGVEGLGGDSWPLQDFLGDDDDERTGEMK